MEGHQLISEAEWQVMREVWAKGSVTSGEIISALSEGTQWEPTTVKTLLSRLVKKEVLGFHAKGRSFHYYPLVTEEACIMREMRAVVDKVYGGVVNRETPLLVFKGDKDLGYIDLLEEALTSQYDRISDDLGFKLPDKQLIYLHTTQKRLHSALGVLEGPKWLRGGYTWGILHLAPLNCFDDIRAEKAAVHTLTQIMIDQINPSAPYWLQQAVAAYEGQWLTSERIGIAVRRGIEKADLSMMRDMAAVYLLFKESSGYELAYTVADYIFEVYGREKMAQLLRSPTDFIRIFGRSEEQFWQAWRQFATDKYLETNEEN